MKTNNLEKICADIKSLLNNRKAENIKDFDLSKDNNRLSDVCLICSGTSSRHAQTVSEYLCRFFKNIGVIPDIAGDAKSGWIMVEALGIEIHIFKPDVREYYDIEGLLSVA